MARNALASLPQGAAERRVRLEAQILAKAGRVDEGRTELYGGAVGQRARLWARWFDPTTMKLPADVCAPFQSAGVREAELVCPVASDRPDGADGKALAHRLQAPSDHSAADYGRALSRLQSASQQ